MLLRLAAGTTMGVALAAGAAATLALGAGAVGAALLARRLCEERRGWRADAEDAPTGEPAGEPGPDAPSA